jgi:hypothetical protein
MQPTTEVLEDHEGQFVLLPQSIHIDESEVWVTFDEATGVITLNPKLSSGNEASELLRQRDIETMTALIAAKKTT